MTPAKRSSKDNGTERSIRTCSVELQTGSSATAIANRSQCRALRAFSRIGVHSHHTLAARAPSSRPFIAMR